MNMVMVKRSKKRERSDIPNFVYYSLQFTSHTEYLDYFEKILLKLGLCKLINSWNC